MGSRVRFVKNAVANVARGGAIAAFSLMLPPILVRHMAADSYSVWVLVLQAAAYIGYFDCGLQIALGRYIAFTEQLQDRDRRDAMFSTSLLALLAACAASCVLLLLLLGWLPHVFPAVPGPFLRTMRWTLLIVGLSMAVGLPASVSNAVFVGLQRNEVPAAMTGGGKLLAAAGLVVAVMLGYSLISMAVIMAVANLLTYGAQYVAMRRLAPGFCFKRESVHLAAARELFSYCLGITIMSVSMLLVSGFDVMLVGRFEFGSVVGYSIAASFIPIISGLLYAVLNAMMPHAAGLHARGQGRQLGDLVVSCTRLCVLLLVVIGGPAIIYARPLLQFWLGPAFTPQARLILIVLMLANMIRLAGAAYSIILVAAAQQRLIKISPLAEGVSNLVASLLLGVQLGAIGVALGTVIGAIVSMGAHFFYNMPRTASEISFSRQELLWAGIVLPLFCTSPLLVAAGCSSIGMRVTPGCFSLVMLFSLIAGGHLLFRSAGGPGLATLRERFL